MENLEATLSNLRKQPSRAVTCSKIRIDKALQPRDQCVIPYRDRYKQDDQTAEQVSRFRQTLTTSVSAQLDAVLTARIDGALYLLDGHHRLKAYNLEARLCIPTRSLEMPMATAVLVSKLVNLGGVKLPLHKQQASECAWQYLAAVTYRGKQELPPGLSTRIVSGKFGIATNTVWRMLKRLPQVDLRDFGLAACDSGTHWPQWKHVRGNVQRGLLEDLEPETRDIWQATRYAKQQAKLFDKYGPKIIRLGIELLKKDSNDQRLEALISINDEPLRDEYA